MVRDEDETIQIMILEWCDICKHIEKLVACTYIISFERYHRITRVLIGGVVALVPLLLFHNLAKNLSTDTAFLPSDLFKS